MSYMTIIGAHVKWIFVVLLAGFSFCQERTGFNVSDARPLLLRPGSITPVMLPLAGGILGQTRCDSKGDIYLSLESAPLVKMSSQTGSLTTFELDRQSSPKVGTDRGLRGARTTDFAFGPDGNVYILVSAADAYYVIRYSSDGKYDSNTKLDTAENFRPIGLAVFPQVTSSLQVS
jgi:hypothetical protein